MNTFTGDQQHLSSAETIKHYGAPLLSVVICCYNGAAGLARCLQALQDQTTASVLDIVVVDDGSTDQTAHVARSMGARLESHMVNRGLAAARNTGIRAALATYIAFLDDDCEPEPQWAASILARFQNFGAQVVGGPVVAVSPTPFMQGFLIRNNPLSPLPASISRSDTLGYRLLQYLKRNWSADTERHGIYALPGANMAFDRELLIALNGFDERFTFGGEDLELFRRLWDRYPSPNIHYAEDARVRHHFKAGIVDSFRRSRAYGMGGARFFKAHKEVPPTFFPGPLLVSLLLLLGIKRSKFLAAAALIPQALFPSGARASYQSGSVAPLLDSYLQLLQETGHNIGYVRGLIRFRDLGPQDLPPLKAGTTSPAGRAGHS